MVVLRSLVGTVRRRFRQRLGPTPFIVAGCLFLLGLPVVWGGEALVRAHLPDPEASGDAIRVYARPLTLTAGASPSASGLRDHLQRLGYREVRGGEVSPGEFYLGSRGGIIGRRMFRGAGPVLPVGFAVLRWDYRGRVYRMEDEEGRALTRFALEPEFLGRVFDESSRDRLPVDLLEVPEDLVDALLVVEDQRFFQHGGLDFRRIAGAFTANLKAGQVVQGGSTLTQQLAKNLFLHPRRTLSRKVREAMMATVLEWRYSKEELLQAYLNHVYLGQDGAIAIHGVGRAAQHFFGKDVSRLDLPESALLVALIRAPSLYNPRRNPVRARERRNLVLRLMQDAGRITSNEMEEGLTAPLGLKASVPPGPDARYFLDYVQAQLASSQLANSRSDSQVPSEEESEPTRPQEVRSVVTSLDLDLQRAAEDAVEEGLQELERRFDWLRESEAGEPLQAALVAMDPHTGEILAMVGGRDYGASQFNRAVYGRRQPGSAFKPVVALAALSRRPGPSVPPFTLASVLEDAPLRLETRAGVWEPSNYDGSFHGPVTLREALERSLNVPFARLGLAVGPEWVAETARQMGISEPLQPYPSLALGASEVTPLELTRAFGVLAADGFRARLSYRFNSGRGGEQVFDPAETYLVTSALRGAVEEGTGQGIRERGFRGDVAAKSGTTNDFRDGWFVGYTPSLVVGVWVGFDHGRALELPGASLALPIFTDFLLRATGRDGQSGPWGGERFSFPAGLDVVEVDPSTGLRGGWGCPGEPEFFLRGTAPEATCNGLRFGDGVSRDRWGQSLENGIRVDEQTLRFLLERGGQEVVRVLRRLLRDQGR